jgi:hypothetical protein
MLYIIVLYFFFPQRSTYDSVVLVYEDVLGEIRIDIT